MGVLGSILGWLGLILGGLDFEGFRGFMSIVKCHSKVLQHAKKAPRGGAV